MDFELVFVYHVTIRLKAMVRLSRQRKQSGISGLVNDSLIENGSEFFECKNSQCITSNGDNTFWALFRTKKTINIRGIEISCDLPESCCGVK